jgi:stage V sporulation protein R
METDLEVLSKAIDEIWAEGEKTGLDPFPIHFEVVPASIMYEIGAYGLPGRFSHWSHGKAFHQMKTMYDYGLSKIYELIINTNPAQAFLMEANSLIQNKLVIAHVIGHSDFFKKNVYFAHTSRQMVEVAATHADRLRKYEFHHGRLEVEKFLDAVLAIQEHIDPNLRVRRRPPPDAKEDRRKKGARTTPYDDLWRLEKREREDEDAPKGRRPTRLEEPEKDLLWFIGEYAPDLEPWQRDIVNVVREEMLYFLPQMQTKIMNEGWACATGESLLLTERGILRFRDLYERREAVAVASGAPGALHRITDFHTETRVPTIRVTTRRGYTLEGALKHRLQRADGSWAFLTELQPGDQVTLATGTNIWGREPVAIDYLPAPRDASLGDVALAAETSLSTVIRHRNGDSTRSGEALQSALLAMEYRDGRPGKVISTRRALSPPPFLNEPLAHLLGYFVGDGNVTKSGICLTCGDEAYARRLTDLVETVLGVPATLRDDATATGPRWRIEVHSRELLSLLEELGIDLSLKAAEKQVPEAILRSPRAIVAAFLSGYFDADAYAGPSGVILSSASCELIQTVQVILLNDGILSTQRRQNDGCIQLHITGASASRFHDQIGFKLERKQAALEASVENDRWFKQETATDEIVTIEAGEADVFDITVDVAHAYVACGFVNHNSFWHSRILRDMELPHDEHIEFVRLHSSVLSPPPRGRSINPYYVGFKMFEDIERRWNGDLTDDERREYREENDGKEWPYKGQGREKMMEVREVESDVSFLRNYLTANLVEELDLYIYRREGDQWVIVEKDWRKIRDSLVGSMTNFGFPYIVVEDGDFRRNRELYLKHCHDGRDLDLKYAQKTLQQTYLLWGRPVHLETILEDKKTVFSFDGEKDIISAEE